MYPGVINLLSRPEYLTLYFLYGYGKFKISFCIVAVSCPNRLISNIQFGVSFFVDIIHGQIDAHESAGRLEALYVSDKCPIFRQIRKFHSEPARNALLVDASMMIPVRVVPLCINVVLVDVVRIHYDFIAVFFRIVQLKHTITAFYANA
jgi:hypothetical protein